MGNVTVNCRQSRKAAFYEICILTAKVHKSVKSLFAIQDDSLKVRMKWRKVSERWQTLKSNEQYKSQQGSCYKVITWQFYTPDLLSVVRKENRNKTMVKKKINVHCSLVSVKIHCSFDIIFNSYGNCTCLSLCFFSHLIAYSKYTPLKWHGV